MATQVLSFISKASGSTRMSAASRRASPIWQMPIPKPALIAANCARSLSALNANQDVSNSGMRRRMLRTEGVSRSKPITQWSFRSAKCFGMPLRSR
jgi:hypothetical protein